MTAARVRAPSSLLLIAGLLILGGYVAWLAVRTTAVGLAGSARSPLTVLVRDQPDIVLGSAMASFGTRQGQLAPSTLAAVRRAAVHAPLDDRPYLFVAGDYLRRGDEARATTLLEEARRRNPRQRWTHLLLLDRYLRTNRFAAAAEELSVLARLVNGAQGAVAAAMAQMSVAPQTSGAVRRLLRQDPALERLVLTTLAATPIAPATLFALASPAALASANGPGAWGTGLVDRLVAQGRYGAARAVWLRINRIDARQGAAPLYDQDLSGQPGGPPFGWSFASGSIGAADVRNDRLEVNYYGRDSGDLASQLLVLSPGRYRFAYTVTAGQRSAGSALVWTLGCENQPARTLAQAPVPIGNPAPRLVAFDFAVPSGCPAQRLRLSGQAGQFPTPLAVTIDRLQLRRTSNR